MNISEGFNMNTAIPIYVGAGGCGRFDVTSEVRRQLDRLFGTEDSAYMIGSETPHWHPIGRRDLDMHIVSLVDKDGIGHTVFFRLTSDPKPVEQHAVVIPGSSEIRVVRPADETGSQSWIKEELIPQDFGHDASAMPEIGIDLSGSVDSTTNLIKQTLSQAEIDKHEGLDEKPVVPKKKEARKRKAPKK